jgi:hypothetical protein
MNIDHVITRNFMENMAIVESWLLYKRVNKEEISFEVFSQLLINLE